MSAMREELHHLVDQLPEAELQPALELIHDPGGGAFWSRPGSAVLRILRGRA